MNDSAFSMEAFEARLAETAAHFPYPETPAAPEDVLTMSARPPRRRMALAWSLAALIVLILGAFAVPPVRAAVVEFFQVGVMRIFFDDALNLPGESAPTPLPKLENLAGRTTLAGAAETVRFPLSYPAALGEPDEVYVQEIEGPLVLMVWIDGGEPAATLLILGPNAFTGKGAPQIIEETEVNGRPAAWLTGDHLLFLRTTYDGFESVQLFEAGNVLLWDTGRLTYRLEGFEDLADAVRVAETMQGTP